MFLLRELIPNINMCALKVIVALIVNECFPNIKVNGLLNWIVIYL